jgi:hypothetical protein
MNEENKKKIFARIKKLETSDGEYAIIAIDMKEGDFIIGANKMNLNAVSKALSLAIQKMTPKKEEAEKPTYVG